MDEDDDFNNNNGDGSFEGIGHLFGQAVVEQ